MKELYFAPHTIARAAFMHGFEVFFLVDGTATYTAAYNQASLLNLSHGFAELMLVWEISDSLLRSQPRA